MSHVIDTKNVMHFAIAKGEELRALSTNNLDVAEVIHSRSIENSVCEQPIMLSVICEQLILNDAVL